MTINIINIHKLFQDKIQKHIKRNNTSINNRFKNIKLKKRYNYMAKKGFKKKEEPVKKEEPKKAEPVKKEEPKKK